MTLAIHVTAVITGRVSAEKNYSNSDNISVKIIYNKNSSPESTLSVVKFNNGI